MRKVIMLSPTSKLSLKKPDAASCIRLNINRHPRPKSAGQGGKNRSYCPRSPLTTVTTANRHALTAPALVQVGYGEAPNQKPRALDIHQPLGTVVAGGGKHALVAAFLAQHNGGPNMDHNTGRCVLDPVSTVTTTGGQQGIIAAHMVNMHGTGRSARDSREPLTTNHYNSWWWSCWFGRSLPDKILRTRRWSNSFRTCAHTDNPRPPWRCDSGHRRHHLRNH